MPSLSTVSGGVVATGGLAGGTGAVHTYGASLLRQEEAFNDYQKARLRIYEEGFLGLRGLYKRLLGEEEGGKDPLKGADSVVPLLKAWNLQEANEKVASRLKAHEDSWWSGLSMFLANKDELERLEKDYQRKKMDHELLSSPRMKGLGLVVLVGFVFGLLWFSWFGMKAVVFVVSQLFACLVLLFTCLIQLFTNPRQLVKRLRQLFRRLRQLFRRSWRAVKGVWLTVTDFKRWAVCKASFRLYRNVRARLRRCVWARLLDWVGRKVNALMERLLKDRKRRHVGQANKKKMQRRRR